jgi:hypothetical protein
MPLPVEIGRGGYRQFNLCCRISADRASNMVAVDELIEYPKFCCT